MNVALFPPECSLADRWHLARTTEAAQAIRGAGHFLTPICDRLVAGNLKADLGLDHLPDYFEPFEAHSGWYQQTGPGCRELLRGQRAQLAHQVAQLGQCDAAVMLTPCTRSAHVALGWCAQAGVPVALLLRTSGYELPELWYGLAEAICCDLTDLARFLEGEP